MCSLRALAAIAENRRTINDVLTAINASANHGVFLRILRMIANGSISGTLLSCMDRVNYSCMLSNRLSMAVSGCIIYDSLLHLEQPIWNANACISWTCTCIDPVAWKLQGSDQ